MGIKNISPVSSNFSGSVPEHYEQYLGPLFFEPYAIDISQRINPSSVQRVLEIACGTGRATRHLRAVIPSTSELIASDVNPDMLAMAQKKLKEFTISWRIIDAQQLPFEDNSLDLVVCSFGYMFVGDKSKAFAEAFRVLKPGGMLLFSTWDKLELNEASYVFRRILRKYFEDPLPPSYNLPFSFNDPAIINDFLLTAGFSKIVIESVEKMAVSRNATEAANGLTQGGSLYNEIIDRNPLWVEEITATVEKELAEKYGAAPMSAPMKAVVCQAWK
jgi:ubiquinone/menaquinone biosynthesis C-methylase UbiE